jgi:hypothetical protein
MKDKPTKQSPTEIRKLIDDKKQKLSQLQKEVKFKEQNEYRKKRARRLIETGALAEKYFDLEGLDLIDREELFKIFTSFIIANKPKKILEKQEKYRLQNQKKEN